ncbi:trypsin-like peptidase domain-containing protein [Muricoccus vinaceus]|uniref:Trypsin-like peptidase domain-containing protein n=1 Tax=Muricoccus vinaceus TaxID=424704 RepID=A0ABV6IUS9_9PROT
MRGGLPHPGAPMAALLAALCLSACATSPSMPSPRQLEPAQRLPDIPDAFRAELLGGRSPDCRLRGNAVYLGQGRFLTAAHLVDDMVPRLRHCSGIQLEPTVVFGGYSLPVRLLRVGEGHLEPGIGPIYRKGEDLALLQALTVPAGPAAVPCPSGPLPGQDVVVRSAQRRAVARAGGMVAEDRAADGAYADLPIHLEQGESGAGVFDAQTHCLLGVVSHRPDDTPGHSRIVPSAAIRAFLFEERAAGAGGQLAGAPAPEDEAARAGAPPAGEAAGAGGTRPAAGRMAGRSPPPAGPGV